MVRSRSLRLARVAALLAVCGNITLGAQAASHDEHTSTTSSSAETSPTSARVLPIDGSAYIGGIESSSSLSLDALPTSSPGSEAFTSITDAQSASEALRTSIYWGEVGDKGGLSVNDVLQIALKHNPNWGTYAANHAAAHAELLKACAFPNPSLDVEYGRAKGREKDDEGNRPTRDIYNLAFSQPIELPGKRLARQVEARAGFAVAQAEGFEFSASLRADVMEAYYNVQFQTAQERLWQTLLGLADELYRIATRRVELGEAGKIEQINARVEVLRATRERNTAQRRKLGAMAALNALTGSQLGKRFRLSEGLPSVLPSRSEQQAIKTSLACHPRLARLAAELEQRYASLDRQRTDWWPDVSVGVRKAQEFDANSVAVTASVEIPLWNRNQGGVAAAEAQAQKTYNDIAIAFEEVRRDVEVAYQNYELSRDQIRAYEDGLRAAAEQAVGIAWFQYREGAAGYLDVLTARRLLQETEQEYIQARYDAALSKARLERATGSVIPCPEQPRKVAKKAGR